MSQDDVKGKFLWYELMTTDTKAAGEFYRRVIGWETKKAPLGDPAYTIISAGPSDIGGIMALPKELCDAGGRPGWGGYIAVDDVDAYVARVQAKGGALHRAPVDVPGVLRFAVVADPYGAVFTLFKGMSEQGPVPAPAGTPRHVGWHELLAGDGPGAFAFYSDLFGWTKAEAVDMGPMGVYQTFATGGAPVGGMMTKTPQTPAPFWLYYINVESVDAVVARAKEGGARLTLGPDQVPGGSWIAQLVDPQGAVFAIVGAKR